MPFAWLAGIVVAALGVAITNFLVAQFGEGLGEITQTGDPVVVNNIGIHQNGGIEMAFPRGTQFAGADMVELEDIDQRPWFASRGAVPVGAVHIQLTLSGNRQEGVRILDLTPVKDCSEPLGGTYFYSPAAGAVPSLLLHMDMDDPQPQAVEYSEKSNDPDKRTDSKPYFNANTVTLTEDEQIVFALVVSAEDIYCTFDLELSVLDGNDVYRQRIDNNGTRFSITPELPRNEWEQVLIGGVGCGVPIKGYLPASAAWLNGDDRYPCEM